MYAHPGLWTVKSFRSSYTGLYPHSHAVQHGSGLGAFSVLEASHRTLPYPTVSYPTLPYPDHERCWPVAFLPNMCMTWRGAACTANAARGFWLRRMGSRPSGSRVSRRLATNHPERFLLSLQGGLASIKTPCQEGHFDLYLGYCDWYAPSRIRCTTSHSRIRSTILPFY